MKHFQLTLIVLTAFVLVLHTKTVAAGIFNEDKPLISQGLKELKDGVQKGGKQIADGLKDVGNSQYFPNEVKGVGNIIYGILTGAGGIAGGALGV